MTKSLWFQHFEEQLQGLETFYKEAPRTESLLAFALAKDLLKEEEYFNWAQKHYGLSKIKASYFVDLSPSESFWKQNREIFTWSDECLPIGFWDGHLLIACLDPEKHNPETMKLAHPPLFFLADPRSLSKWFSKYQSFNATEFSLELKDEEAPLVSAEEAEQLDVGSPDGFDEPLDLQALNKPEGIEIDIEHKPVNLNFASLRSPEPATPPPPPTAVDLSAKTPPPPPPVTDNTLSGAQIRPIPHIKASTAQSTTTVGFSMDPWKADFLKAESQKAFQQMKNHFEKSLILALSDDESKLKVQLWDESFQKPQDDKVIPLKTPSIFNIVVQTMKPFHGPISLNDVNEQFFETWNKAQIPSHVTLTPILVQEKMIGILMGFGNSQAFNKSTLSFAEKVSTEISEDLSKAAA